MTDGTPGGPAGEAPDWDEVKRVLGDALELPAEERPAYLARTCAGRPELLAEVESLLDEDTASSGYLEVPAAAIAFGRAPRSGDRIGGFTLGEVLGEGGMGRVFRATQERPRRVVALKVLRPALFSAESERRFHFEVEALGRLAHPGIAKVLGAGVDGAGADALPWYAMELVEGQPLTEAADAAELGLEGRLDLFLQVADAVAHAHQRGVIHRDLKPDNILVDAALRPHVLDFGIARLADPLGTTVTTAGQIVGTLGYMSPEQLGGDPDLVDVRSDVYALGVLLFRLVTGEAPLELGGLPLPQVARVLAEEEPRRAGTLDRSLRGDLETILDTALARVPERRYPTVDAFAADVRRYLANEPIDARTPTAIYQLTKFARRHRGLVAGLSLAFLAAVGGAVGMGILAGREADARELAEEERKAAREAQRVAERDRDRAQESMNLLSLIFGASNPIIAGEKLELGDVLTYAAAAFRTAESIDPLAKAKLHGTLGDTFQELDRMEQARVELELAVEGYAGAPGEAIGEIESRAALAEVLTELSEFDGAREQLRLLEERAAGLTDAPAWVRIRPLEVRAWIASATDQLAECIELRTRILELWKQNPGADADGSRLERTRGLLANALQAADRSDEARVLLEEGVEAVLSMDEPDETRLAFHRIGLVQIAIHDGRHAEVDAESEELVGVARRLFGIGSAKTLAALRARAAVVGQLHGKEEALAIREMIEEACIEAFGADHDEAINARHEVAVTLLELGRHGEAEPRIRQNLALLRGARGEEQPVALFYARSALAGVLEAQGRHAEAVQNGAAVLAQLEELMGSAAQPTLIERNNLAVMLMKAGRIDEAVETAETNLDLARTAQPGNRMNEFPFRSNHARILSAAGRHAEAIEQLHLVEHFLEEDPSASPAEHARIRTLLAETYGAAGDDAAAARYQ